MNNQEQRDLNLKDFRQFSQDMEVILGVLETNAIAMSESKITLSEYRMKLYGYTLDIQEHAKQLCQAAFTRDDYKE